MLKKKKKNCCDVFHYQSNTKRFIAHIDFSSPKDISVFSMPFTLPLPIDSALFFLCCLQPLATFQGSLFCKHVYAFKGILVMVSDLRYCIAHLFSEVVLRCSGRNKQH